MNRIVNARRRLLPLIAALALSVAPFVPATAAHAASPWQVNMGAENKAQGVQVAYFFPGNITVDVGDTIFWNYATGEPHSVVFDEPGSSVSADSGLAAAGAPPFSLQFNQVGDFPYHCGLHTPMKGSVHVNAAGTPYPTTQDAYNQQSLVQQNQLIAEGLALQAQGLAASAQAGTNQITAGIDVLHDMGGIYLLRFLRDNLTVKVGDTVTFTNRSSEAPHTITMNENFTDPFQALVPDGLDYFGPPGHATVGSPTQAVNSGFLWAAPPPFVPPALQRGTVFQMTFTAPGTYKYYCELHDDLGMTGTINVTPKS